MPKLDALKLTIASGVTAFALAAGCSSTTQVKGSGKSDSGADGGAAGAGGGGNAAGEGGTAGNMGTGGAVGAGAGGAGAGGTGAGGAGAASGSAGTGAGRGGVSGSGGAFGSGGSGAAGTSGVAGTGAVAGTGGVSGMGGNGCAVVTCAGMSSCCTGTAVFVLDTPLQNYRDRPDLVTRFSVTPTAAVADFRFDASGQRGNIGFDLNRATDVFSLFVDASYSGAADYPYVALETGGGARGCAYALVGTEADFSYPFFCWGTPAFALSETTRVNVRVDSNAVGSATLSISGIDVN
jgi:hypothetical protein